MLDQTYQSLCDRLVSRPQRWLVTGAAGFIGSHLVERLLELGQSVVGLDNFATGRQQNLSQVQNQVGPDAWAGFDFVEGDICDLNTCRQASSSVQHVLHQAALGSVPRSIKNPIASNDANISGFLNMLVAARDAGVQSFTFAASSSTYGDHEALPKQEDRIGNPLSPYAVTKLVNELYASVFARTYEFRTIGLRYFNVFGPRQDPAGAYAAVIPKWIDALRRGDKIAIYGDGETSRDFCYVENVVQANLLSACAPPEAKDQIYNVAVGGRTTLNELFGEIRDQVAKIYTAAGEVQPEYLDFRPGDVRHSQADINKIQSALGYQPQFTLRQGLQPTVAAFLQGSGPVTSEA